jgi:hypothetical protein
MATQGGPRTVRPGLAIPITHAHTSRNNRSQAHMHPRTPAHVHGDSEIQRQCWQFRGTDKGLLCALSQGVYITKQHTCGGPVTPGGLDTSRGGHGGVVRRCQVCLLSSWWDGLKPEQHSRGSTSGSASFSDGNQPAPVWRRPQSSLAKHLRPVG